MWKNGRQRATGMFAVFACHEYSIIIMQCVFACEREKGSLKGWCGLTMFNGQE